MRTALTRDELAVMVAWFETTELPSAPPFRSAPWVEIADSEEGRAVIHRDPPRSPLRAARSLRDYVPDRAPLSPAKLWAQAKRIAPPEVQAVAHTDELVEQHGRQF